MEKPKYKPGDYILISGKCEPNLIGKTALIRSIEHNDYYMLEFVDHECWFYPIWRIVIADQNSTLNEAYTVLYGSKT